MKNKKTDISEAYKLFNTLLKKNIIKFKFHDNSIVPLEPIKVVHNKIDDTIEIDFRNVVKEDLEELKRIINNHK